MFWLQLVSEEFLELIVFNVLLVGVIGLIVSFIGTMIPPMRPYRPAINLISCILLIAGSYFQGGFNKQKEYHQRIIEMQKKLDEVKVRSDHMNEEIDKKVNEKLNKLKDKVDENRREIDKNKKVIDSDCKLPDVARMLYNRSVDNEVSGSTSKSDARTSDTGKTRDKQHK